MQKNWMTQGYPTGKSSMGTAVLVVMSIAAGLLLSQSWEQVLGQPAGSVFKNNLTEDPQVAPQVVVQKPAELPKWCVNFVTMPPLQGESLPRFQVITIVDTETKRIAVYHLDMSNGSLRLLSVRDIQPDLMLDQFNATSPLPSEIIREMQRLDGTNL